MLPKRDTKTHADHSNGPTSLHVGPFTAPQITRPVSSRWRRANHVTRSLLKAFLAVIWAYAWMIPIAVALRMGPPAAAALMMLTVAAFVVTNVVLPLSRRRRLVAYLRLRPAGRYLPLLTLAVGAKLVLMLAGFVLHQEIAARRILPRLPEDAEVVSSAFMTHPLGAVALLLAIVILAPLIEEFAFRGKMQRALERSLGIAAAIVIPALVFSALHGLVDAIHHLPFGVFVGWVVWRTGSLWGAVYMHVLNNAAAWCALYLPDRWPTGADVPSGFWPIALGVGIAALATLMVIAVRIDSIASQIRPHARGWRAAPAHRPSPATRGKVT